MMLPYLEYGITVVPAYNSPIIIAKQLPNITLYSKEISESLYVAAVYPPQKTSFSEKLNSRLTIKSSFMRQGYSVCLK